MTSAKMQGPPSSLGHPFPSIRYPIFLLLLNTLYMKRVSHMIPTKNFINKSFSNCFKLDICIYAYRLLSSDVN